MRRSKSKKTKLPKPKSPELQAFVKKSSQLHVALNGGVLARLAWDLHEDEILSLSAVETITHEMLSDSVKASKLVSALEKSISTESWKFNKICHRCSQYIELKSTVESMKQLCVHFRKAKTITFIVPEKDANKSETTMCGFTNTSWSIVGLVALALILISSNFYFGIHYIHSHGHTPKYYDSSTQEFRRPMSQQSFPQIEYDIANHSSSEFPLPSQPDPFVGRSKEMKEIIDALTDDDISIVGLFGPPAFGKSTLAIHIGHHLSQKRIPVSYINLNEFRVTFEEVQTSNYFAKTRSDLQLHHIHGSASKAKETRKSVNVAHVITWAESIMFPTILILDNCDQVINQWQDEFQELVRELLITSPQQLTILITSQMRISFLEHFSSHRISELSLEDSYSLITKIYPTSKIIQKSIAELVGNCPLAIKVIVTLLKQPQSLSPEDIVEQLRKNTLKVLSSRELSKKDRFTAVMDTAFHQLTKKMRNFAFYLSLFPGSFGDGAITVTALNYLHLPQDPSAQFEELVGRSLIERFYLSSQARYRLHKLIKDYFNRELQRLSKQLTMSFEMAFKKQFRSYYSNLFINNMSCERSLSQSPDLFSIEQNNVQYLLTIVMPLAANNSLLPEETALVLFAYREGLISPEYLPIFRFILKSISESESLLKATFTFLNDSSCSEIIAHIVELHLNTGLHSSMCLLLKNMVDNFRLQDSVLKRAWCSCSQKFWIEFFILVFKVIVYVYWYYNTCLHYLSRPQMYYNSNNIFIVTLQSALKIGLFIGYTFTNCLGHVKYLLTTEKSPVLFAYKNETIFFFAISFLLVLYCSNLNKAAIVLSLITFLLVLEHYFIHTYLNFSVSSVSLFHFVFVTVFFLVMMVYYPFNDSFNLSTESVLYTVYYSGVLLTTVYIIFDSVSETFIELICHILGRLNTRAVIVTYPFFSVLLTFIVFVIPSAFLVVCSLLIIKMMITLISFLAYIL